MVEVDRDLFHHRSMRGPDILVRTISRPTPKGKLKQLWQYHSRSDHHSKVACWAILFDLLGQSHLLRDHAERGRLIFGINHKLTDFKTGKKKKLDLVLATPGQGKFLKPQSLRSLAVKHEIQLAEEDRLLLEEMPDLQQSSVGVVHVAFEAKACMTEHVKASSRLFDELNSSHEVVHGASDLAIAAAFVMVNVAERFISTGRNTSWQTPSHISQHDQPRVTEVAIRNVLDVPRRNRTGIAGFDAFGVVVVETTNDGTPVRLSTSPPAPQPGDATEYESMIQRVAHLYESRFPHA